MTGRVVPRTPRRPLRAGVWVMPRGRYRYALEPVPQLLWCLDGEGTIRVDIPAGKDPRRAIACALLDHFGCVAHRGGEIAEELLPDDEGEIDVDDLVKLCFRHGWQADQPPEQGFLAPVTERAFDADLIAETSDDSERHVVTIDRWDVLVVEVEPWGSPQEARVGIADLDARRELVFDAIVDLVELADFDAADPPRPDATVRVATTERAPGIWVLSIDQIDVVQLQRTDDPVYLHVIVLDRCETRPAVAFAGDVRYRQLPVARPLDPSERIRRLSEALPAVPPLATDRGPW